MAYEKNQYSYFQNINLDTDGALIVNTNGGARTAISTPVLYSAITVDTSYVEIYLDLDGSLGNTFVVDFNIVESGFLDIIVMIGSITNFNNGDNLYLTCNFSTPSSAAFNFSFPTYIPETFPIQSLNMNEPKSMSFNAPVWNNLWLFPNKFVAGRLNY